MNIDTKATWQRFFRLFQLEQKDATLYPAELIPRGAGEADARRGA